MPVRTVYSSGDWNTICDVCGRRYKDTDLRKRWDGLMVCSQDFEERQPQDFVRARADQMAVPWSRPEGADTFVPINYTPSINETNNLDEVVSKYVTKIVPDEPVYSPDLATDEGLGLSFLGKYTLAGEGTASYTSNQVTLSELVNAILTRNIAIAETVSVSEVSTKAITKDISENITPTETVSRGATKVLSETSTLSETASKVVSKVAADSLTTTEAFVANLLLNQSLGSQFLGKTTLG